MPHASDCAFWVDEPCDCITGREDALVEQTMGALEVLELVLYVEKATLRDVQ